MDRREEQTSSLATFINASRSALQARTSDIRPSLDRIATALSSLTTDEEFIQAVFNDDTPPGHRLLYRDPDFDFRVLAHVQREGKRGLPHDHGNSWAVYSNASAYTDMSLWRRVNEPNEDAAVLELVEQYRIRRGDAFVYAPGVIHSTSHPEKSWLIRVTGTDVDVIPRYRFRPDRDRIVRDGQLSEVGGNLQAVD